MFKKNKINFGLLAGYSYVGLAVSSLALVLLALAIFWTPYMNSDGAAATDDAGTPSAQSSYTNPTVSIALADRIDLDITPTAVGATTSASATLTVATTESPSYSIYLSASDNNLRSTAPANTSVIAPAEIKGVGTTIENLEVNTWGYSLTKDAISSTTIYRGASLDSTAPVVAKDTRFTNTANDVYNLSIGVKADSNLTAGVYSGSLLVSVVADPPHIIFDGITTMQEITSDICANAWENDTKQLIDTRDGNSYWVAKLKDGNCWMTQNLDLNLTTTGLSASDTDIDTDWNSSSTYKPVAPFTSATTNQSLNPSPSATYSWDFGKWVLSVPGQSSSCGTSATSTAVCVSYGFIDVSGSEWQPAFVATGTGTGITAVDEASQTYDAHYLKGWHLPLSGGSNNTTSGSFYNLLSKYGLTSTVTGTGGG